MDESSENVPVPAGAPRPFGWRDGILLLALLAAAAAIHTWLIRHTEVTARDGVGFIRYAWQLQSQPWAPVLRANPHPPLYPLTILAASSAAGHLVSGSPAAVMQVSAQVASALAGVLLVIPMFLLGRELFSRAVGFWAALLFQCLPLSAHVLSDALSEGLFLLLTATALLLAVRALRSQSVARFALCGLCGGLAYLTRPEGMLIVATALLILLGVQAVPGWRQPWRRALAGGAAVLVTVAAAGAPYAVVIGQITNKTTGVEILQTARSPKAPDDLTALVRDQQPSRDSARPALLACTFATFGPGSKDFGFVKHHAWCLATIGREIVRGYHYVTWLPALFGLVWFRGRLRQGPGPWVPLTLIALQILVLWRVAYVVGYVAERHSLVIVMASLFWAVAGLQVLGDGLAALGRRLLSGRAGGRLLARGPVWSVGLLLGLAGSGLPKTLEPLHTNRAGFHAAGLWLAEHASPQDVIIDPFSWVEYYSGQVYRSLPNPTVPSLDHDCYVVLGGSTNEHSRLPMIPMAKAWAAQGTEVFHWPTEKLKYKAEEVVIYHVPGRPPEEASH